jgi:heat shock protein HslJ
MMIRLNLIIALCCLIVVGCANKKQVVALPENSLNGTWELNYISGPRIAFEGLYKDKKPTLIFDTDKKRMMGNTSCNSLNGALLVDGNKIDFKGPIATTKMFCPGEGEQLFLESLKKINTYSVADGNTLTFMMGDVAMMRFKKINQ